MSYTLSFDDLSLFLGLSAIILLATSELVSPFHGKMNLTLKRSRVRKASLIVGVLFMITVVLRILEIQVTIG